MVVAVVDNTTEKTLLSCEINATTKSICSTTSESGTAAAGDNLEVRVTFTGGSGNNKHYRATFRY